MLLTVLAESAEASALGLNATGWVAVGMLIVFGIMLWAKVPKIIGAMLDKQIAEIKKTLDEAANLRKEAEALKAGRPPQENGGREDRRGGTFRDRGSSRQGSDSSYPGSASADCCAS